MIWENAPIGTIAIWMDVLTKIPIGWRLCDGNAGRPNLFSKFLKEVPNTSTDPGGTGGASSHGHTAGTHNHVYNHPHTAWYAGASVVKNPDSVTVASGGHGHGSAGSASPTIGSAVPTINSATHLPNYITAAFIIKVS